jgi:hypothetical protein
MQYLALINKLGKGYLKTKQRHGLLLIKLLQTHNSLEITRTSQFWQPKGIPELWLGMKKKGGTKGIYS